MGEGEREIGKGEGPDRRIDRDRDTETKRDRERKDERTVGKEKGDEEERGREGRRKRHRESYSLCFSKVITKLIRNKTRSKYWKTFYHLLSCLSERRTVYTSL